ncbi:GNAT family N-acetyltransferase [Myroides odoratus]|uniref:GNAT family N-acetyltransferase n=1 Tax=Myroides odoratus TaxID=256 RepID=UPI0034DB4948
MVQYLKLKRERITRTIYGFDDFGVHSIEALIYPDNIGSQCVLEKCGFVREAYFKESEFHNGKFVDTAVYSILAE